MNVRPFISYAREDRVLALQLYRDLRAKGAHPWIDIEDLLGGEDWKLAISAAIGKSSHFIALISAKSVSKQGYVQKELRQALDLLDTFPPGEVFLIPVRLDASEPRHGRLADLHWIDLFPDYSDGLRRLLRSVRLEPTTPEPSEYQSHGSRGAASVPPSTRPLRNRDARDEEGFLTPSAVAQLVLDRVQGRQQLRQPPILLFENSHQHTWLVITERIIACVLDDTEKGASYDPLRWECRHRFALPVEIEAYKRTVGLIHLGDEHRDWLYSTRLHPKPQELKHQVESLLSE